MISVVVPLKGEAFPGEPFLSRVLSGAGEILVAAEEGLPLPVREAWERAGALLLASAAPRGERLSRTASLARGEVLLFLHSDTLLPRGWGDAVGQSVAAGAVGGAFRLAFDGGGRRMAIVAAAANLRTAITRVPYGDQAPFVRRDVYARLGGHAPWPLLEDVDLFRRLRREGRIALLRDPVLTSPRRYLARGALRTVLGNRWILLRWRLGASPSLLAVEYGRGRTGRPGTGIPPGGGGTGGESSVRPERKESPWE